MDEQQGSPQTPTSLPRRLDTEFDLGKFCRANMRFGARIRSSPTNFVAYFCDIHVAARLSHRDSSWLSKKPPRVVCHSSQFFRFHNAGDLRVPESGHCGESDSWRLCVNTDGLLSSSRTRLDSFDFLQHRMDALPIFSQTA